MADSPHYLNALLISGFRAYLQPKSFDFSKKRSLAIFAPNGNGKSTLIDALEFLFSKDGTLERLGVRASNNNAGVVALAHNLAEEAKIEPKVTIDIVAGATITRGSRLASGSKRPIPEAARVLNDRFVVSPIIRGHALRSFVEVHSPEQRYTDVANWLQLGPFVEVQKNLRTLRSALRTAAEDDTDLRRVDEQLAKETAQSITRWDAAAVLTFVNETVLAKLDQSLAFTSLASTDTVYNKLKTRCISEEKNVGLEGLKQIRTAAETLYREEFDTQTDKSSMSGAIVRFAEANAAFAEAEDKEAEERGKAANATFKTLWEAAEPIFAEGTEPPEACPVCDTPILATKSGSASAIRQHLRKHLAELSDYAAAKAARDEVAVEVAEAHTRLSLELSTCIGLLHASEAAQPVLSFYKAAIAGWTQGADTPSSEAAVSAITALHRRLQKTITDIEEKQGDHTYAKAKIKIDRLIELQDDRTLALRTQKELRKLSENLTKQSATISGKIRDKVQAQLDKLQTPMNEIYRFVQGDDAVPIRLELPSESDTNQQRLHLVVDFAENREGVQPGGYLSDSQIHSVALALRLSAIKLFNSSPIIALDDIVTSYDADHRRSVAGIIADLFRDFQVIITTHDERFFNYLQDQLDPARWQFTRIIGLDPTFGPRFADHKITDEMIEERWADGQSAANEMRQAEEEWLLRVCRDFGVSIRIRPLEKPYSYDRGELASALANFLNVTKLRPPSVSGVNNRFLASLQKGEIENFGSHFQEGPYGVGSKGDEKARWKEFKEFRDQFSCRKCGRLKFKRPVSLNRPVCAHDGCEAQFEFAQMSTGSARA